MSEVCVCAGISLRALACCSHELQASLRVAKPLLVLQTARSGAAVELEFGGLWRVHTLTLVGTREMQKAGCGSSTWDILAITARSQAVTHVVASMDNLPSPTMALTGTLSSVACLEWLTELALDGWGVSEDSLVELASAPRLTRLALRNQVKLSSLASLACFPWLEALELTSCWRVVDLAPLAGVTRLASLELHRYKGATLAACASLRSVSIFDADKLCDLWALSACTRLERLTCAICHEVEDLSPLSDCSSLSDLRLDRCTRVRTVAPLSACRSLHTLTLSRCPGLTDLGALDSCARLRQLTVLECSGLTHFSSPARVAQALARLRRTAAVKEER